MYHATHGAGPSRMPHTLQAQQQQRPPPTAHGMRDFIDDSSDRDRHNSLSSTAAGKQPMPPDYLSMPQTQPTAGTRSRDSGSKGRPPSYPSGPSPTYEEFAAADREQSARAAASSNERQNRRHRYRRGGSEEALALAAQEQMQQARGAVVDVDQAGQVQGPRVSPTGRNGGGQNGTSPQRRPHRAERRDTGERERERDAQRDVQRERQQRQPSISNNPPREQHLTIQPPSSRQQGQPSSPTEQAQTSPAGSIARTPSRGVVASVLQPLGRKCDEYDALMAAAQADMARLDEELARLAEQRAQAEGRFNAAKGKHDDYRRQYVDVERALSGLPPLSAGGMDTNGMDGMQRNVSMGGVSILPGGQNRVGMVERAMSFQDLGHHEDDDDDDDIDYDEDEGQHQQQQQGRPRHVFGEKKMGPMEKLRKSFFGGS
jgi:hypothetical protein